MPPIQHIPLTKSDIDIMIRVLNKAIRSDLSMEANAVIQSGLEQNKESVEVLGKARNAASDLNFWLHEYRKGIPTYR